ncbi:MAG: helix-turn-helix domain-containing protein [Treponema sp.]|jgi:transcriptional regulator with XRE-family HTH domain|nr:helix-turn-helix domain-containing protein [Treponema sp.]
MTLQQIFIINLKKKRKERGISQMILSRMCDTTSNYIGQIEMGRRIPSFEKIEKIAAALKIPSHELFACETAEKQKEQKPNTKDHLQKMPANVKKEIIARLTASMKKDIDTSLNPQSY